MKAATRGDSSDFWTRGRACILLAGLGLGALLGCSTPDPAPESPPTEASDPQALFFAAFAGHCGQAYRGTVVSNDAADEDFAKEELIMHVRDCEPEVLRIPFHVGENRSRTWVLDKTPGGLRLKHDHRHEDGTEDAVTQYGGTTADPGQTTRQEFPADHESKEMFVREGLDASVANTWAMEIRPGAQFAYELRRPNRFFRVEFDLTSPIATPPSAWGAE